MRWLFIFMRFLTQRNLTFTDICTMNSNKQQTKRKAVKKKRYWIPVTIILALIIARLLLPYVAKKYVNKTLANIPGYYGQVEDIDIALYRGAYVIKGLYLNKVDAQTQVPFLNFPQTDISVEWKSIFDGKIVAEIEMFSPQVTYIFEDQNTPTEGEEADVEDWTAVLTYLVPLEINHFEVHDGKLGFAQISTEPQIDLYMDQVEFTADNLRNVKEAKRNLPSPIKATGVTIGQGLFDLDGKVNLIKEIPDMDIDFALENANITAINDLTRHYGGIDFKSGTVEVFGEIAIADGYLKGYVKPLIEDSKLISKEDGILGVIWEGFVGVFKFILKNQGTNTLALKVSLEGDLNNVETGVLPTILSIFQNGWINAFKTNVDEEINFSDAEAEADKISDKDLEAMSGKDRRAYKKEQRIKRREKRRDERQSQNDEKESA